MNRLLKTPITATLTKHILITDYRTPTTDHQNMDTQWPRWEVFKQDRPGKPFEAVGTVHAPDAEMALLNARDVFVRRPECHTLWVAPEAAVLRLTAQELAGRQDWPDEPATEGSEEMAYHVFLRQSHRRSMVAVTLVGQVLAASSADAMRQAVAQYGASDTVVWWVVPDSALIRSNDDDIASMFEPALEKTYRDQTTYRGRIFEGRRRGGTVKEVPGA